MPHYYHEDNYHRRSRLIRKIKHFTVVVLLVLAGIGLFIGYDTWRSSKQSNTPSAPSVQTKTTFASSFEVYRTEFFQFQASKTWKAISNESSAKKFVYRKFNKNLVEAQLDIYVNEPVHQILDANRVLPVTFNMTSDKLNAIFVSEHCAKEIKNKGYETKTIGGVTIRCNTDTTNYSVIVGKEGGTTLLEMLRPDGSKVTYVIYFRDLRAITSPQEIQEIISTFQTR